MDDEIEKPVRLPELIVEVTLPPAAQSVIANIDTDIELKDALAQGLDPEGFTAQEERAGMTTVVEEFLPALSAVQLELLRGGLLHAYGGSHAARVAFNRLDIDYQLNGVALDITDRTVDEDGTSGPMEFIFGVFAPPA